MPFTIRRFWKKSTTSDHSQMSEKIPAHIAIIMDGNGRWAAKRGLPRTAGHYAGMSALRRTIRSANDLGIEVLTVYAFSTENWSRPKTEVEFLMRLPNEFLRTDLPELIEKNVQVRMSGDREGLPAHTQAAVDSAIRQTAGNTGMVLNFALNYGSRMEIVEAVKKIAADIQSGLLQPADIDENMVSRQLYTGDLPDPDLLIRCSGEIRLSNFLLWQLAYAELWFTEIFWPDFKEEHLLAAIETYQARDRRFGGLKAKP